MEESKLEYPYCTANYAVPTSSDFWNSKLSHEPFKTSGAHSSRTVCKCAVYTVALTCG